MAKIEVFLLSLFVKVYYNNMIMQNYCDLPTFFSLPHVIRSVTYFEKKYLLFVLKKSKSHHHDTTNYVIEMIHRYGIY